VHISRIEIENFRAIASLDLMDLPSAVVVVGENGTGKSTLLEALRLVLDPSLSDSDRELDEDDFYDGLDRPFCGAEIRVAVEVTDFADDRRAKELLEDGAPVVLWVKFIAAGRSRCRCSRGRRGR
jgi:putative ATP-dependent endonuclease of OLD family